MALYVIGDLHLSFGVDKPMDIFGGMWVGYEKKLETGLSVLNKSDTLVLAGDTSWGMSLEEALPDLMWINQFPGRKLLLKGNHDYWWTTSSKFRHFCEIHHINDLFLLQNCSYQYEEFSICGTRGWFYEEERGTEHDSKMLNREIVRLGLSLESSPESTERLCFLHYPPIYHGYDCVKLRNYMETNGVRKCWYGHLHGKSHKLSVRGMVGGIEYNLVSADYLGFRPLRIL